MMIINRVFSCGVIWQRRELLTVDERKFKSSHHTCCEHFIRPDYIEDIWVFQCNWYWILFHSWTPQSVFHSCLYFTKWTPQAVFSRVAVATSENTDCGVHEWNKIQSYTEKKNFCFFYAFICNNYVFTYKSTLTSESYFFPSHFASISSCSACLVGIIWGKNIVLYLENEPKCHFNN